MWNNLENSSIFTPEQIENRRVAILLMARICFMPRYNWENWLHQAAVSVNCWLAAVTLFFYTGRSHEWQAKGFLLWMRRNGYRVIAKDLQLPDGSKKANLDVEIAVDMMALGFLWYSSVS